jgi:hypothetical protein
VSGRSLAGPAFPGDDGAADPRVSAALGAYVAGHGSEHAALTALAAARLLVPVVAVLTEAEPAGPAGPGQPGLRRDKSSDMALPTLIGADGRAALPAFTSLDSLARWRADARPVPVPASQVWQSGAQEAGAVVIDVAGPVPLAVDGARLAALAAGRPAPPPHQDPDVLDLVHAVLLAEPMIAGFRLLPGEQGADLTLCLVPVTAATEAGLLAAAERASASIMTGAGHRLRRGIEVTLAENVLPGAAFRPGKSFSADGPHDYADGAP